MRPARADEAEEGPALAPDATVSEAIEAVARSGGAARVVEDGRCLGVVDHAACWTSSPVCPRRRRRPDDVLALLTGACRRRSSASRCRRGPRCAANSRGLPGPRRSAGTAGGREAVVAHDRRHHRTGRHRRRRRASASSKAADATSAMLLSPRVGRPAVAGSPVCSAAAAGPPPSPSTCPARSAGPATGSSTTATATRCSSTSSGTSATSSCSPCAPSTCVLLAAGWAGVTAGGRPGRLAGRRSAARATAVAGFASCCGLLGMWVPTMQTLALMVVAVLASVVLGALLGLAAGLSDRTYRAAAPRARHHAGAAGLRVPAAGRAGLRHRRARRRPGHRRVRGPADGPAHRARAARRRRRRAGGRRLAGRDRPAAAADRPAAAGPQGTPARPQPDDHDGAVDGRHRVRDRRGRPR